MASLASLIADLTSGDDQRADASRAALRGHGPGALPALTQLAESPQPDHRWWAVRCLAERYEAQADQLLIQALEDPDLLVRQAAALALRDRPLLGAIPALVAMLASEDSLLSRLASDALAAMGSVATAPLAEALQSPSPSTRIGAARALALNLDPAAVPSLYAALEDTSRMVEYWATEGLERRGLGMVYFLP